MIRQASTFDQQCFDFPRRQGGAIKESLDLIAHMLTQEIALLLGLDSFGDNTNAEMVRHRNDGLGSRFVNAAVWYAIHACAIDFHTVERESLQTIQR